MAKLFSKTVLGILVIWVFHGAGILGIYFGNRDWFITKSPLNLLVSLLVFLWLFPIANLKRFALFFLFFTVGMFAEWLGVTYGLLFGAYAYGNNLGPKLDGVPLLIGTYWALLTFVTATISAKAKLPGWIQPILGASLMVILDVFMEKSAPIFDFWTFYGGVPLDNYLAWFGIGLLLQYILFFSKVKGNFNISLHLYLAQLLFFLCFYLIPINP